MPRQSPFSRRSLLRAGSGAAVGLGLGLSTVGCGSQPASTSEEIREEPVKIRPDGNLLYYNWEEMTDPAVLKGFEKEYGVRVIESVYSSMDEMATMLNAGKSADVIFPSAQWADRLIQQKRLRRIDPSKLRNADSIFSAYGYFTDPWYDPNSRYTIPYTVYKTGIAWRRDKLGNDLGSSWNDLWDLRAQGKVMLLDDIDEVLAIAELKLNLDLGSSDPDELDRISKVLSSLHPQIHGFSNEYYDQLGNGDGWIAQAWSGDMSWMFNEAKDPSIYGFGLAKEGAPINSDCYAIPSNAPHPGTAMLFIDYMLRLENVKKNIKYLGYPMPVFGSEDTYAALVERNPECVVSAAELGDYSYFRNNDKRGDMARTAVWRRLKAT